MNSVNLVGRLARDPELRYTPQGTGVCNFTIAVDSGKDRDPHWIDVVAWQQLGETCAQYLRKGRQVAVSGYMQTRKYEAKDGAMRKVVEVVASRVDFLGSKDDAPAGGTPRGNDPPPEDDDVPF